MLSPRAAMTNAVKAGDLTNSRNAYRISPSIQKGFARRLRAQSKRNIYFHAAGSQSSNPTGLQHLA